MYLFDALLDKFSCILVYIFIVFNVAVTFTCLGHNYHYVSSFNSDKGQQNIGADLFRAV